MAAPMLAGSFTPRSTIFPTSPPRTFTLPLSPTTAQPAAVAVHWAVGERCPPYSRGRRNCRSAEQKWELVTAAACRAAPLSTARAASSRAWAMVEHAPYCPKKGTWYPITPKVEEMHWFSKSPAKIRSRSSGPSPARASARATASFCSWASACSQVSMPRLVSPKVLSKSAPRGPWASRLPPTAARPSRAGGRSKARQPRPTRLMPGLPTPGRNTAAARTPPRQ